MNAVQGGEAARLIAGSLDHIELGAVPERFRQPLTAYLHDGVMPADLGLRRILEGSLRAVPSFERDLHALLLLTRFVETLPACCWGSPDQVALWSVYCKRQRAREKLAEFMRLEEQERGAA